MRKASDAVVRDLVWEAELGRVLGLFGAAGIPAILLKGAAYRGREYARGERRCRDADLLLKPADLGKAAALLRKAGYAVRRRGEVHATRPGPVPFDLDLHGSLFPDGDAGLWERAEPVTVAGREARVLRPSDAFVYALWHGAVRHATADARLSEDLGRIAARGGERFWREVEEALAARGLRSVAAAVLPGADVGAPGRLLRPRSSPEAWVADWGLKRGPRGGTGHLLMAMSAPDRWRAAGRLLRSAARFLRGN